MKKFQMSAPKKKTAPHPIPGIIPADTMRLITQKSKRRLTLAEDLPLSLGNELKALGYRPYAIQSHDDYESPSIKWYSLHVSWHNGDDPQDEPGYR